MSAPASPMWKWAESVTYPVPYPAMPWRHAGERLEALCLFARWAAQEAAEFTPDGRAVEWMRCYSARAIWCNQHAQRLHCAETMRPELARLADERDALKAELYASRRINHAYAKSAHNPVVEQNLTDAVIKAREEAKQARRERDEAVALIAQLRAEGQAAREALQQVDLEESYGRHMGTRVNDLRRTTAALLARLEVK